MGLDISYGNTSFRAGSYSGFHAWRVKLAEIVGLSEAHMFMGKVLDKPAFEPLLNHSDCDGKLTYRQCVVLQRDFNRYMFAALETMNTFGGPGDGWWWFDRYVHWKQAVDAVAKREVKQIEFC